jgi:hypothetical protein
MDAKEGFPATMDINVEKQYEYDMNRLKICPRCGKIMRPDLILKDGRGINSSPAEFNAEEIAGYGFFCESCKHGWTGDELAKMT